MVIISIIKDGGYGNEAIKEHSDREGNGSGYEKHKNEGDNSGNNRNGYNRKTIISDYGEGEIVVPRDRNGEFEPKVLEKRQTRTDEIEQKILEMYAKGMSQRDIEDSLREIYGAEIPQTMISKITDNTISKQIYRNKRHYVL